MYFLQPVGPAIRPQQEWNQNKHWTADNDIWQAKLESNIARENGIIADTYSWFCNRGGGGVAGVAFVAELCNRRAVNLNERQRTYASSGFVSYESHLKILIQCFKKDIN